MENVRFFFVYNGQLITMPVNPEEFQIRYDGKNETMDIVKLGEVNILKQRSLAAFEFTFMLPWAAYFPYIVEDARKDFKEPQYYIDFFRKAQEECQPLEFAVSNILESMDVSIERFEGAIQAQDEDTYIKLTLKEYKKYGAIVKNAPIEIQETSTIQQPKQVIQTTDRPATTNKKVTVGCDVIINGRLFHDSYGNGGGQTRKDYKGKINFIKTDRSHPYHVTTPTGEWQGWVVESSVKVI